MLKGKLQFYHKLGLIFVAKAIGSVVYDRTVLTNIIADIDSCFLTHWTYFFSYVAVRTYLQLLWYVPCYYNL